MSIICLSPEEPLPDGFRVLEDPTPDPAPPPVRPSWMNPRRLVPRTVKAKWTWLEWPGVPGGYYRRDLHQVFGRQEYRCAVCGRDDERLYGVRRIPASRGGTNFVGNLVGLCARCKEAKRGLTMSEFRMKEIRSQRRYDELIANHKPGPPQGNGMPARRHRRFMALAIEHGFMRAENVPVLASDPDGCVCKKGQAAHIRGSLVCKHHVAEPKPRPWWWEEV